MKSVLGLLLLLFAAPSYGLESVFDATQDAVCYGALGGPVMLQLMKDTTGYGLYFSKGEGDSVFSIRWGTVRPTSLFPQGRWQVVAGNGTLIINPAERSDSGTYRVAILMKYPLTYVRYYRVQLVIGAPVSDLDLSISCLANGKKVMWCSSNGDSPEYSWSLDGRALSGADADLSADNQTVLLKGNVIGQLTCTVSNHVSTASITKLTRCPGSSPVFITVWLAEIIVFASLLVGGCYLQMRGKRTHTAGKNQEVELSPASMSRSRRRRRDLGEGEGPSGDNNRESVTYENGQ